MRILFNSFTQSSPNYKYLEVKTIVITNAGKTANVIKLNNEPEDNY